MKKAFTMIELVFVIVVIGILAAVIVPSTRTNPTQEAAVELQSHIRYTQHLALTDDKYGTGDWYKNRWQVVIEDENLTIQSNNGARVAVDPQDSSRAYSTDYGEKYRVLFTYNNNCPEVNNVFYLSFDHLGRPLTGDLNNYTGPYTSTTTGKGLLTANCDITITGDDGEFVLVTILSETVYVSSAF